MHSLRVFQFLSQKIFSSEWQPWIHIDHLFLIMFPYSLDSVIGFQRKFHIYRPFMDFLVKGLRLSQKKLWRSFQNSRNFSVSPIFPDWGTRKMTFWTKFQDIVIFSLILKEILRRISKLPFFPQNLCSHFTKTFYF